MRDYTENRIRINKKPVGFTVSKSDWWTRFSGFHSRSHALFAGFGSGKFQLHCEGHFPGVSIALDEQIQISMGDSEKGSGSGPINAAISKIVASWTRCCLWGKVFVSVTQWKCKTSRKSSASKRILSVSLSSRPCTSASKPLMDYFFVSYVGVSMFFATYIEHLFQSQWVDSSIFPFDI